MSRPLIWRACGLTLILALCAPGGHGLQTGVRGFPGAARSPVLATVRVGPNPVALAVDRRSQHVLVVSGGGVRAEADGDGKRDIVMANASTAWSCAWRGPLRRYPWSHHERAAE